MFNHQPNLSSSHICDNYNIVINMRDNFNRTPMHYACIMNDEAIIRILQKGNAKKVSERERD